MHEVGGLRSLPHNRAVTLTSRLRVAILLGLALTATGLWAKQRTSRATPLDRDYVSALGTANRFLQAWQGQDHEAGLLMLTDTAKKLSSEEKLEQLFSPGTPAGFEIGRGRRLKDGRYSFPVTLFVRSRPRTSQIIVIKGGKDDWAVDRVP